MRSGKFEVDFPGFFQPSQNEGLRYRNMALDQSFTTASSLTSLANSGTPLAQKEINYKNILVGILVALFAVLLVKWLF